MSSPVSPSGAPHRRKRPFRKRYAVLLALLALLLIALAGAIIRGTWADKEPRDPKSSDDGVICRLYQPPEGDWQVRCSMILDDPPDKVWNVITDYANFADIFSTLKTCDYEKEKNGDARLFGEAHSALGDWPFDIIVKHEEKTSGHGSHWEGDSGTVQKLKGSWTVSSAGEGKTLLVYASHVEIKRYPDWVVVNSLLLRQPKVMQAVADWLAKTRE